MGTPAALPALICSLLVGLTPGCATLPADPTRVEVTVVEPTQVCGASDARVPVELTVRNQSNGRLKFGIDPYARPPYPIGWTSYKVLTTEGIDWRLSGGGHGPMPPDVLSIGRGDTVHLTATVYSLRPTDYARHVRIQFEDLAGNSYSTRSFAPCVSTTSP